MFDLLYIIRKLPAHTSFMTWEALSIKVHFQFICKESFKFFQTAKCHQFYVISKSLVINMTYRTVM